MTAWRRDVVEPMSANSTDSIERAWDKLELLYTAKLDEFERRVEELEQQRLAKPSESD